MTPSFASLQERILLIARKVKRRLPLGPANAVESSLSYSQCGEDRIVALALQAMGIARPTYLDVGANHPVELSNTYLFYRFGGSGVCVEANPKLCTRFKRARPRDICLNIGVGPAPGTMALKIFEKRASGLTTFCSDRAAIESEPRGYVIEGSVPIEIVTLNRVINDHFAVPPNFLSIDIEGMELPALRSLNFDRHGPDIICVETLLRTANSGMQKEAELISFVEAQGYRLFADTYINSIFVREDKFPKL